MYGVRWCTDLSGRDYPPNLSILLSGGKKTTVILSQQRAKRTELVAESGLDGLELCQMAFHGGVAGLAKFNVCKANPAEHNPT